jgi:hypothetical protein
MFSHDTGRGTITVQRRTLYEQVWSVPGSQLAAQYGISDVGLAKACKRHNVPRPPRGYWARVQAGQKVRRTPLPKPREPYEQVVHMQGWDLPDDDTVNQLAKEAKMPPAMPIKATRNDASPPHALVEAARAQLAVAKADLDGLMRTDAAAAPALRVAPVTIDRALAVLDSFVKRWEARGGTLRPGAVLRNHAPLTAVGVGQDEFTFEMGEVLDEDKPVTDPTRRTGRLFIQIGGDDQRQFRRRWHDTKTQPLERLLSQLVETLAKAIEVMRLDRLDAECVARQERRAAEVRKAADDRESREFYWRQDFHRDIGLWHEAERARAYLRALCARFESGQYVPKDRTLFERWLAWATRYCDAIDPLVGVRHPDDIPPPPQNTQVNALDVTSVLRITLKQLAVADSDALSRVSLEQVREARGGGSCSRVWKEVTRLLQGLGYDVSKRPDGSYW